jgi:hypothetical protein
MGTGGTIMASPYEILKLDNIRLRSMIDYAMDAPDYASCKSILADALDGVNGAENYEEVKGEREALRARCAVLEKVAEEIKRLREAVEWALGQADCFNEKIMIELRRRAKEEGK